MAKHRRDRCMSCGRPPTIEILWAEGMAHAWFCDSCFEEWKKEHEGDIDATKKIEHGITRLEWSDKDSPETLRVSFVARVIGRCKVAAPWSVAPTLVSMRPLVDMWALHAYERLAAESNRWRYRVAVDDLTPIESDSTPDTTLRWLSGAKEWRGLNDPRLWESEVDLLPVNRAVTEPTVLEAGLGDTVVVSAEELRVSDESFCCASLVVEEVLVDDDVLPSLEDFDVLVSALAEAERISPPFSSPGGKYYLAPTIVESFPPHTTFVEPFAGSAAVTFAKPPTEKEVLNDLDPHIYRFWMDLKHLTASGLVALSRRPWEPSEKHYQTLEKQKTPRNRLDRLYRFLYLAWFSYGGKWYAPDSDRKGYFRTPANWNKEHRLRRLGAARERISKVTVTHQDANDCIKRWDSPNTLFYLDPPYPGSTTGVWEKQYTEEDLEGLARILKSIKGKFILSLSDTSEHRELFSGFNIRRLSVGKGLDKGSYHTDGEKTRVRSEILVTNYSSSNEGGGTEKQGENLDEDTTVVSTDGTTFDGTMRAATLDGTTWTMACVPDGKRYTLTYVARTEELEVDVDQPA